MLKEYGAMRRSLADINPIWSDEELVKIIQGSAQAQTIENDIATTVSIIFQNPLFIKEFPAFSNYSSQIRTLKTIKSDAAILKEIENCLASISSGNEVKNNFIKIKGSMKTLLKNLESVTQKPDEQNVSLVLTFKDICSRIYDFFNKDKSLLMIPSLNAILFEENLQEISEKKIQAQLESLNEASNDLDQFLKTVFLVCSKKLAAYKNCLTAIDKIIFTAAQFFSPAPDWSGIGENPVGLGLALRADATLRQMKDSIKDNLSEQRINQFISENRIIENEALEMMNDQEPESFYARARECVNEGRLAHLPLTTKVKVLSFLAENDPNYAKMFKRKTIKLIDSFLDVDFTNRIKKEEKNDCTIL